MLGQVVRQVVAIFLMVVFPSTLLMAERPSAMLYANGAVMLNGIPAAKSMSVFAGDRIDTADASRVSVLRTGLSLVVDSNSSVQYQTDGFTVVKGTASARTSNGVSARVGPISVTPKGASALFDIKSDGKTMLISSREGAITVTDGVQLATVEPGYTARVSYAPQDAPAPAASASGQQPSQAPAPQTTAGSQEEGPKPAATTSGDENHERKKLIIVIVITAAAAAAIVCILECGGGGPTPISPVTP
jgi:hypothetical protein